MNETVNQETSKTTDQERTFTQEEMNAIISDRLSRERAKYSDYEDLKDKAAKYDAEKDAGKSELQKAQDEIATLKNQLNSFIAADSVRKIREQVANEKGIPAALLSMDTKEECEAQADAILNFAKPSGYPNVKDKGEPRRAVGKQSTREQFAEWFKAQTE